jgi:hypothetical protein
MGLTKTASPRRTRGGVKSLQPFKTSRVTAALGILATVLPAAAQSVIMSLPLASPRATVSQRIALTDVTITCYRPHVSGRKVFGEVVPYGQVWRAGANENTVVEVSDPVVVEGQALPKGAYGLHMIPNADSWTVIFSKNSTSWGSFSYDPKEDALRVTVKPVSAEMREALTYDFTDVTPESAVMRLECATFKSASKIRKTLTPERALSISGRDTACDCGLRRRPQY